MQTLIQLLIATLSYVIPEITRSFLKRWKTAQELETKRLESQIQKLEEKKSRIDDKICAIEDRKERITDGTDT